MAFVRLTLNSLKDLAPGTCDDDPRLSFDPRTCTLKLSYAGKEYAWPPLADRMLGSVMAQFEAILQRLDAPELEEAP